ncbi:MAG TPA: ABC transporter substrate-binding protein [Verrucomicrobiae bacterium]|jgi:NitT/TauT family transport system substrate-binding protein|nr:ABC transporter substrate-binding protein [Verrucomicrobiae bacterium]
MPKTIKYLGNLLALALAVGLCSSAAAAEKILIVHSALNLLTSPVWMAKEKGYFLKYGLDVETVYIPSGTLGMQALLGGETKMLVADGSSAINARMRGAPVKIFLGMVNYYPNPFFSSPDIKTPADLKGKKIAVTRIGSSSHTATIMLLKKLGLEEKDYTIMQLGSTQNRLTALTKGLIQGTTLSAPESVIARNAGMKVLVPASEIIKLGVTFQHQAGDVMESTLKNERPTVKAFAKAYLEGVRETYRSKEESMKVVSKYTRISDPQILSASYDEAYQAIEKDGNPTEAGVQVILSELAKTEPRARSAKPADFIDTTIIGELTREGFLKTLWGK